MTDLGEDAAKPLVRLYRTAADIGWHCDLADVVGLLCLRTARRGGASRIVSSVAVYDELLRRRTDLVDRLYEPFALDTRDEQGEVIGSLGILSDITRRKDAEEALRVNEARVRTIVAFSMIGVGAVLLAIIWGLRGRLISRITGGIRRR